jgi:hypothetical protein
VSAQAKADAARGEEKKRVAFGERDEKTDYKFAHLPLHSSFENRRVER